LADLRARAEPGAPEAVNKPQTAAAPTSSPATSEPYEAAARGPVSRQAVIAVVIAALVLFGIVGVFASRNPAAPAAPSPAPAVTPAPMSGAGESSSATAAAPEATPEPPSVVPSPPAPAAKAETKSADAKPAAAAGATLRLRFSEPSWVEVTQGDGRVLVSQVNEAGTEQRFAGQPPYRLVIGNASTVSVEWRGRVVDLKPATNFDNVARITLE
jgi:cytoskeleton protein RodZ